MAPFLRFRSLQNTPHECTVIASPLPTTGTMTIRYPRSAKASALAPDSNVYCPVVTLDRDLRADGTEDHQVAPREAGGAHHRAGPIEQVRPTSYVFALCPRFPAAPGVEPGDHEIQKPDDNDHMLRYTG